MYLHGRTETIRSCSKESIDFANAMLNPKSGEEEKLHTLKAAIQGHKDYTIQVQILSVTFINIRVNAELLCICH